MINLTEVAGPRSLVLKGKRFGGRPKGLSWDSKRMGSLPGLGTRTPFLDFYCGWMCSSCHVYYSPGDHDYEQCVEDRNPTCPECGNPRYR